MAYKTRDDKWTLRECANNSKFLRELLSHGLPKVHDQRCKPLLKTLRRKEERRKTLLLATMKSFSNHVEEVSPGEFRIKKNPRTKELMLHKGKTEKDLTEAMGRVELEMHQVEIPVLKRSIIKEAVANVDALTETNVDWIFDDYEPDDIGEIPEHLKEYIGDDTPAEPEEDDADDGDDE